MSEFLNCKDVSLKLLTVCSGKPCYANISHNQCVNNVIALNGVCLPSVHISVLSITISVECNWLNLSAVFHLPCTALQPASMETTGCCIVFYNVTAASLTGMASVFKYMYGISSKCVCWCAGVVDYLICLPNLVTVGATHVPMCVYGLLSKQL